MEYRNIEEVRELPDKPGSYVVFVELKFDGEWERVEYVANPGGGGISDDILGDIASGNYTGEITVFEYPVGIELPKTYSKAFMFMHMTDDEYTQFEGYIATLTPRQQAIFNNAVQLESDDQLFLLVKGDMEGMFGEARVEEVLTASEV